MTLSLAFNAALIIIIVTAVQGLPMGLSMI